MDFISNRSHTHTQINIRDKKSSSANAHFFCKGYTESTVVFFMLTLKDWSNLKPVNPHSLCPIVVLEQLNVWQKEKNLFTHKCALKNISKYRKWIRLYC